MSKIEKISPPKLLKMVKTAFYSRVNHSPECDSTTELVTPIALAVLATVYYSDTSSIKYFLYLYLHVYCATCHLAIRSQTKLTGFILY